MGHKKVQPNKNGATSFPKLNVNTPRKLEAAIVIAPTAANMAFANHIVDLDAEIEKLEKQCEDALMKLDTQKRKNEELEREIMGSVHPLLGKPLQDLNFEELSTVSIALEHAEIYYSKVIEERRAKLSKVNDDGEGSNGTVVKNEV